VARQLYIFLLLLHPAQFRYRFGLEMLAVFDEAATQGSTLPLLADGVRSLVRQWVHPYRPVATAAGVADGANIPVFCSFDHSLPRRHLMTGAVFTLALFSALMTAINLGGRSVGIMFRPLLTRPHIVGVWEDSVAPSEPTAVIGVVPDTPGPIAEAIVRPAQLALLTGEWASSLYPIYGLGVLDRNGDMILSAAEMVAAPAMLRTLDRDDDGSLRPGETYLVLAVFDRDRDGIISSTEINRSAAVLRGLDANGDGTLVLEEVVAAVLAAAR